MGAYDYCTKWLKKYPKDAELNQCAGIAATGLKDYKGADKFYSMARKHNKKDDQLDFLYYINLGFTGRRSEGEKGLQALCKKGVRNVCECIEKQACFAALDGEHKPSEKCLTCEEYKKNFERPIEECVVGTVQSLSDEISKSFDTQKIINQFGSCLVESGMKKFDGTVLINVVLKANKGASAPYLLVIDGNNSADLKLTNCIGKYAADNIKFSKDRVKCNAPFNFKVNLKFTAKE